MFCRYAKYRWYGSTLNTHGSDDSVRHTLPLFRRLSDMTNISVAVTILMSGSSGMLNYVRNFRPSAELGHFRPKTGVSSGYIYTPMRKTTFSALHPRQKKMFFHTLGRKTCFVPWCLLFSPREGRSPPRASQKKTARAYVSRCRNFYAYFRCTPTIDIFHIGTTDQS